MFCSKCGQVLEDNAAFCSACGEALHACESTPNTTETVEEIVDLTGVQQHNAPQEKKYKKTIVASVLIALFWMVFPFGCRIFCVATGLNSNTETPFVFLAMAFLCVPCGLIALLAVLIPRFRKRLDRKMAKGKSVLIYSLTWFMTALSVASGFSDAFGAFSGLVSFIASAMIFVMAIAYIILCVGLSGESGREGLYSVLTAFASSFIPAILLGYTIAFLLSAFAMMIGIIFLLFILFIGLGGRVIYVRRY